MNCAGMQRVVHTIQAPSYDHLFAVQQVMQSGCHILGEATRGFEVDHAAHFGRRQSPAGLSQRAVCVACEREQREHVHDRLWNER